MMLDGTRQVFRHLTRIGAPELSEVSNVARTPQHHSSLTHTLGVLIPTLKWEEGQSLLFPSPEQLDLKPTVCNRWRQE